MATDKAKIRQIEQLLNRNVPVKEIVEKTQVPISTIYDIKAKLKAMNDSPIEQMDSENQMGETETKENSEQGNNETIQDGSPTGSGNQKTEVDFEDETTQSESPKTQDASDQNQMEEDFRTDTAEELQDNDAPAEEFPETNKPDYLLGIESLVNVLSEGNKHLVNAIKSTAQIKPIIQKEVSVATSQFQQTIDQSSRQLNLATKIIEENAETFAENAALLKDAAEHFKSASVSPMVADQQKSEPSFLIHMLFALMVYGLIFSLQSRCQGISYL